MSAKKTEYISLSIALAALILSQFKPLYQYFKSPAIEIESNSNVLVGHFLGELFLHPHLKVVNLGDETGQIEKMKVVIASEDLVSYKKEFLITGYYSNADTIGIDSQPTTQPFTGLVLRPDESFSRYFIAGNDDIDSKERFFVSNLHNKLINEIGQYDPYSVYKEEYISDELYEEIRIFSQDKLNGFVPGNYYYLLMVWEGNLEPSKYILFSFNLSEEDFEILNRLIERYRYAEGLIRPPTTPVQVPVTLKNINEIPKNVIFSMSSSR
ncbi:hypothetical protein P5E37_28090 [Vibrio parahaemolyticus]|nr:hypothetical protein [Vibrio parahaemolyticus]